MYQRLAPRLSAVFLTYRRGVTTEATYSERVRWPWVLGCCGAGVLLNGIALWTEARWKWQGVLPSILVNVGTALLLAALLFFLEKQFTRRVISAGRATVEQATRQFEQRLQDRTQALSTRIDELQAQVADRMRERAQQGDEKVAALAEDVSYETVTSAMTEANDLGALHWGRVAVCASSDLDGVALIFKWGMELGDPRFGLPVRAPVLEIEARIEADLTAHGGRPVISTVWEPNEPLVDVADRLNKQLQRTGRWHGPETMDWSLAVENLVRSLGLAITSRRDGSSAGPWRLRGALYELVGGDWAITEAGIESRVSNGVVLAEADFPERHLRRPHEPEEPWHPAAPEGLPAEAWERLLRLGKRVHPQRRGPMLAQPTWIPWTSGIAAGTGSVQ